MLVCARKLRISLEAALTDIHTLIFLLGADANTDAVFDYGPNQQASQKYPGENRDQPDQLNAKSRLLIVLLPYQPFDRLNESLNACDASLVTIAKGIEGISYPSKLYSSLAIGRPILTLAEVGSELREVVDTNHVGYSFTVGDAEGLADGIRRLIRDPALVAEMGRNARDLFNQRSRRSTTP